MRTIDYETAINGYLLSFQIISFDPKLTDTLQHCIESINFLTRPKHGRWPSQTAASTIPPLVPTTELQSQTRWLARNLYYTF
jgi:hypothetical protein